MCDSDSKDSDSKDVFAFIDGEGVITYNGVGTCTSLYLRHRESNDSRYQADITYYDVKNGETPFPSLRFDYLSSSRNYWYIRFINNGVNYTIADNFYCSFASKDTPKLATLNIESLSLLRIKFPSSSGCKKTIYRN